MKLHSAFVATLLLANTAAQPILINPSFEADPTPPHPGYGLISGWTQNSQIGDGFGLNEAQGPFADNGLIPAGAHVAFIQDNGSLSQTVDGFVPGGRYWLTYYENARSLCCGERAATLQVLVNETPIVAEHIVPIAGGDNPFRFVVSQSFIATQSTLTITIVKGGFGDSTALIDNFQIFDDILQLGIALAADGAPLIEIDGAPNSNVVLEYTNALTVEPAWRSLVNLTISNDLTVFRDPAALTNAPRFYRARQLP